MGRRIARRIPLAGAQGLIRQRRSLMDIISDFFSRQWFFSRLSEKERHILLKASFTRAVEAGSYVCQFGSRADMWYGVVSGFVKVSVTAKSGKVTSYVAVAADDWIGEGSVLKGGVRPYDIVALSDSKIACVPRAVFVELYKTNIDFCQFLIERMNRRLAHFIVSMQIDRLINPDVKVARILGMLTQDLPADAPQNLSLNQSELALLCGLSRPFTNRVITKLTKLGLITHKYGKISILDRAGLDAFDEPD
jgi:CRP-like cAMP-binding protein